MIPQHIKNLFLNELVDDKIVLPSLNVTFKFQVVEGGHASPVVMVVVSGPDILILQADMSTEGAFFSAFLRVVDTLQHTHWNAIWHIFKDKPNLRIYLDQHVANKVQEATLRRKLAEQEERKFSNHEKATQMLLNKFNT